MNSVVFKGKRDRIIIQLNNGIDFDNLKSDLRDTIRTHKEFFSSQSMPVEFRGRVLSDIEEDTLINILQEEDFSVTCILSKEFIRKVSLPAKNDLINEGITKFHRGNLRSGDTIKARWNLVILGDINPGAKVEAKGNIIVFGYLNGTAYAGGTSEEGAYIASIKMNPIQLKIGSIIARNSNNNMLTTNKVKKYEDLEVAFVRENKIVIEKLKEKLKKF